MLDPVTNRRIAYYMLGAIVTVKVAMALHGYWNSPLSIFSLGLFLAMDFVCFLYFRSFHTPRLTKFAVALLLFSLWTMSVGLFVVQSGQVFTYQITDDLVDEKPQESIDSILNTSHILGSHTVHVRPPTIVKLNPNQTHYCVDGNEIVIPLMIKGTPPFYVDYSIASRVFQNVSIGNGEAVLLDHQSTQFPHYGVDQQAAEKKGRKVGLYGIRLSESGVFELLGAREANGDAAKLVANAPVYVAPCPKAKWKSIESKDKCIDDEIHGAIEVEGVFPLTVYYFEQVGRDEKVSVVTGPPFASAGEEGRVNEVGIVDIPISRKVETNDVYNFKIARIVDGWDNSIEYYFNSGATLPPTTSKGMYWKRDEEGDVLTVVGHGQPSVGFQECESISIRTEYDPQFESAPVANVPILFEGEGPFHAEVEFIPDTSMPAQPVSLTNVHSRKAELTALEPGTFQLLSVKDRYCTGSVRMPKACHVQGVDPPTFTFSTSPIEESCFGAIGTHVELSFTGESPFWIEYVIERKDLPTEGSSPRVELFPRERETFTKPRSSLILRPRDPGVYRYIFERVIVIHIGRRQEL
jgi:hypothetical protein